MVDYLGMEKAGRDFRKTNKEIASDWKKINQKVTKSLSEERRKPLKSSLRKKIFLKCKNKCSNPSCRETGEYNKPRRIEIHHIDMKSSNDKISNLKLYCRNCHKDIHDKYFRKKITRKDIFGNKEIVGSKLVKKSDKKKKKPAIKKRKRQSTRQSSSIFGDW